MEFRLDGAHHAYALIGLASENAANLRAALEASGFPLKGNPDFWRGSYGMFDIADARALREAQSRKGISGERKVFYIEANGMTREAQNALLKVFEEPAAGTIFFLGLPTREILLPTLASRLQIVQVGAGCDSAATEASEFLRASIPARLARAAILLQGREKGETREPLIAFLDGLERELRGGGGLGAERAHALFSLLSAKRYARDRAPSLRIILEHAALSLPRTQ